MQSRRLLSGHLVALLTVLLWGTTFISTKILLVDFAPIEILLTRFVIGLVALFVAYPRVLKFTSWREEGAFALAGLLGICLYYLLENFALTMTLAANIGVIVSISPFFIAILGAVLGRNALTPQFLFGFVAAMAGIILISFNGTSGIHFNLWGDLLAVLAAMVWALYSYVVIYLNHLRYHPIQITRRTFAYGIIFILPIFGLSHASIRLGTILQPTNLGNFLFLGLGASAVCFLSWAYAVKTLGAVKTSVYIYLSPVITVIFAALILHEAVTGWIIVGIGLTISGLVISQRS